MNSFEHTLHGPQSLPPCQEELFFCLACFLSLRKEWQVIFYRGSEKKMRLGTPPLSMFLSHTHLTLSSRGRCLHKKKRKDRNFQYRESSTIYYITYYCGEPTVRTKGKILEDPVSPNAHQKRASKVDRHKVPKWTLRKFIIIPSINRQLNFQPPPCGN